MERGIARGLDVDEFAPRLSFFFDVHNDFFEEIAKFRAARRIWARHMRDDVRRQEPGVWRLRTHAQTAGVTPDGAAAVEQRRPRRLPGAGGRARWHAVAAHELDGRDAGAADREGRPNRAAHAADPRVRDGRGEHDRPARRLVLRRDPDGRARGEAERIFAEIDDLGGVVAGIETGYFQGRIASSANRFQAELESGHRLIVGVNAFEEADEDHGLEILRIDESAGEIQRRRLGQLRQERDSERVRETLEALTAAANRDENLLPPMLDAVRAYATLGEIRQSLEDVYGRFKEPVSF